MSAYRSTRNGIEPAGPGYYVANAGSIAQTPCPAGTSSAASGAKAASACMPAPAGYYVGEPGSSKPTPCPYGTYSPSLRATTCISAPAGTFIAAKGSSAAPTPCPAGTYSDSIGATSEGRCLPAYAPNYSGAGATKNDVFQCPAGTSTPTRGGSISDCTKENKSILCRETANLALLGIDGFNQRKGSLDKEILVLIGDFDFARAQKQGCAN